MATRLTIEGYIRKVHRFFDERPTQQLAVFVDGNGDLTFIRHQHLPELVAVYDRTVPDSYLEDDALALGLKG